MLDIDPALRQRLLGTSEDSSPLQVAYYYRIQFDGEVALAWSDLQEDVIRTSLDNESIVFRKAHDKLSENNQTGQGTVRSQGAELVFVDHDGTVRTAFGERTVGRKLNIWLGIDEFPIQHYRTLFSSSVTTDLVDGVPYTMVSFGGRFSKFRGENLAVLSPKWIQGLDPDDNSLDQLGSAEKIVWAGVEGRNSVKNRSSREYGRPRPKD